MMAAAISHGLAAAAFLILALLLQAGWRGRRNAAQLAAACGVTALWSVAAGLSPWQGAAQAAEVLEALRTGGWLLFLLFLMDRSSAQLKGMLLAIVAAVALQLGLGELAVAELPDGAAPAAALAVLLCRLMLAVFGMLLLEQLYRGTPPHERWGVKFACFGIGGLFAYDFYLYSDALLFRRINEDIWAARGAVNALAAPLLAIAASRNAAWAPGLSLSRQMMFRSAALICCALYLLAMASSAWYLRSFGGAWGPLMQFACLFGAAFVLAGVLFSGTARARVKVFINKHFYQTSFDYREEWLRLTRALAADGPDLGQRAIRAVAALVESPAGALWLRRERDQCEPVASWNMAPQLAAEAATEQFCLFMETRQWVIDVPECLAHPRRYGDWPLPAWLHGVPQLWLVVPLLLHGRLFGFIALARARTPVALNWEVRDLLKIAGSQAAGYLAHRESADSLAVARQFESLNRMSAFIVHDLKNLVSQLSLLLTNAERHKANPEFQLDMLDTLAHSVRKMTLLLQKLSRAEQREQKAPLPLAQLLEHVVQARATASPTPRLELADSELAVLADWQRLERVLGHLVQNAIEATPADGSVTLRLRRVGQAAQLELSDSGGGMSEEFIRSRLFKPFDTTKAAGMGIGVFESREYIREIGGQLEVVSTPGVGTTFRVTLPLHAAAAAA